ncbi:TRAP transporter small permease [Thalassotalea sp. SU-HH00458]|uniref:TRAP transporter small permease n=1 Tax=Thalassotalea sp. SU-HH00458 TaxID=3127657 RepID=UPI003108C903
MNRIMQLIALIVSRILAGLMLAIVLTVLWQVFSRYVLQSPSAFSEEVSRFLLIWLGCLGATYCYQKDSHLSLDIVANKLAPSNKLRLDIFCHSIVFIFSLIVMVFGGGYLVSITLNPVQTSAVLGMKMAYIYTILPISGLVFCFTAIDKMKNIIQQLSQLTTKRV